MMTLLLLLRHTAAPYPHRCQNQLLESHLQFPMEPFEISVAIQLQMHDKLNFAGLLFVLSSQSCSKHVCFGRNNDSSLPEFRSKLLSEQTRCFCFRFEPANSCHISFLWSNRRMRLIMCDYGMSIHCTCTQPIKLTSTYIAVNLQYYGFLIFQALVLNS